MDIIRDLWYSTPYEDIAIALWLLAAAVAIALTVYIRKEIRLEKAAQRRLELQQIAAVANQAPKPAPGGRRS